jgi:SET domain-containing protein
VEVFALEQIAAGEWAIELPPVFDSQPASHTIQIDERRHQAYTGDVDDFINHACDPSAYLDVENLRVMARRPIGPGQEITINYAASEWDMLQPFVCACDGIPRTIRGFRHLSPGERQQIAHLVPAWLRARISTEP